MRVVRIVTRLNRGGPLRQLCALVPGLARRGVTGPVLVGEPAAGEEDASDDLARLGVEIARVPGLARGLAPTHDWRAFRWLLACLRRMRPDVVHTHMGKAGALGRLAARAAGVPVRAHTFHAVSLDQKLVELINIAISDINACKPCTSGHVDKSRALGLIDVQSLECIQCASTMYAGCQFLHSAAC